MDNVLIWEGTRGTEIKQQEGGVGLIFCVRKRERKKFLTFMSVGTFANVSTADINKCIFTASDLFMVDVDSQMSCKFAKHNVTLNITASLCHVIF